MVWSTLLSQTSLFVVSNKRICLAQEVGGYILRSRNTLVSVKLDGWSSKMMGESRIDCYIQVFVKPNENFCGWILTLDKATWTCHKSF